MLNKVLLIGNLGRDPEIRTMTNGNKVANLSVATTERWTKDGEKKEKTEWHRVVIFDERLIDVVEKYTHKGSKLYLEGQLQTRKWQDQSGADRYSTEVVLQKFRGQIVLLDSKGERQEESEPAHKGGGDFEDEIPFAPDRS